MSPPLDDYIFKDVPTTYRQTMKLNDVCFIKL